MIDEPASQDDIAELFENSREVKRVRTPPREEVSVVYDGIHDSGLIREAADMGWIVDSLNNATNATHAAFVPIGYEDNHENITYESEASDELLNAIEEVEGYSGKVHATPYETEIIDGSTFRITYEKTRCVGSMDNHISDNIFRIDDDIRLENGRIGDTKSITYQIQ